MKKVLYSLLLFVSIFFVVDKVSAAENTIYFDLTNSNFTTVYDELKPKLKQIQEILDNNPQGHKYVIFIGKENGVNFIDLYLMANIASYDTTNMYCYFNAFSSGSLKRLLGGCRSFNSYYPYTKARYSYRASDEASFDTFITNLSNDILLDWSSKNFSQTLTSGNTNILIDMNSFSFSNNQYDYFSKNSNFILPYGSNVPIYNYYAGDYTLKIGDVAVPGGSSNYFEPSDNYYGKAYDTYTLSNLEYSAIEVKFNINDFPMIDEGNDINLEYEIKLDTDMIIPLLPIPQEKIYRNIALGDYSIGTTMNLLFDEKANNYAYEGTKHYDYWNTITYRFEFPFTNDYVGNITLNFYSDSNYTITLEERSNEENDIKYTELDLTGKYGVGFIPKVSSFDVYNEFYGVFKVPYQNNYRLMFYKDYSNVSKNNLILDKVLLTFENFEYKFTKENKNSYLLFINNNYESGSEASILYNSNYFNYCILDDELSSCDIVNPNTEENVTINPNLGDLDSFGVKDILHSFKTFSNSTNFILENVTNFYNNFLPDELKIFFFISFGFAVIIMITKIVL